MSRHFPQNSESESDVPTSADPSKTSFTERAQHIGMNSGSEDSDSPYTNTPPPPQQQQQETRGRALPPQVRLAGGESDQDEDGVAGLSGARKPYVRSRSRTPRGATSRSRSRGPGSSLAGGAGTSEKVYQRTALPLNEDSTDSSASAEESDLAPAVENVQLGHVALNSGSDTDDAPAPLAQARSGGRAEGRSDGLRAAGAGSSRSRSRGRIAKVAAPMNDASDEDMVAGESAEEQQNVGRRQGRTELALNSGSERDE